MPVSKSELTPKQRAMLLQKRCVMLVSQAGEESDPESFGEKGLVRVSRVEPCGDGEYCFEISEEGMVEIKGKPRREMVWSCTVVVMEDGEVEVFEERGFDERVPEGVLDCAKAPLTRAEESEFGSMTGIERPYARRRLYGGL